ncbi:hypothetical protein BDV95DRAFT_589344 [Massariosphaeria phaeospora]|uniref:F-box domain-containing protein n=1 Tax=Massariosphaeria phaeospora TaxID=100035 RepID=A0A7C8INC5_9PLEO|nr:hypothetical protein BDV95DRAFT_589344 [Massariosphaeria phaeospora]
MSGPLLPDPITAPVPGHHSKTPFPISPDQEDAIIRTTTYHRDDIDEAVIWFAPQTYRHISESSSSPFRGPTTPLGDLDRCLPLELIHEVCLHLDIQSLLQLRRTNARARQVVNAVREYRVVTAHAANAFCALLQTGMDARVTLRDFYSLLCTQSCEVCGNDYGDVVFLPKWIRCCSFCVRKDAREVRLAYVSDNETLLELVRANVPMLTTVPGQYGMDGMIFNRTITVTPTENAVVTRLSDLGGPMPSHKWMWRMSVEHLFASMGCSTVPVYDPQNRHVENGLSCLGCLFAIQDKDITVCTVEAPHSRYDVFARRVFEALCMVPTGTGAVVEMRQWEIWPAESFLI